MRVLAIYSIYIIYTIKNVSAVTYAPITRTFCTYAENWTRIESVCVCMYTHFISDDVCLVYFVSRKIIIVRVSKKNEQNLRGKNI